MEEMEGVKAERGGRAAGKQEAIRSCRQRRDGQGTEDDTREMREGAGGRRGRMWAVSKQQTSPPVMVGGSVLMEGWIHLMGNDGRRCLAHLFCTSRSGDAATRRTLGCHFWGSSRPSQQRQPRGRRSRLRWTLCSSEQCPSRWPPPLAPSPPVPPSPCEISVPCLPAFVSWPSRQ